MIPKLFESNADLSKITTEEGLGRLNDTISCNVVEERNGQYELTMVFSAQGAMYSKLRGGRLIIVKPNDTSSYQAFRIYKITTPLNGKVTVNAHHISYDLTGIPVRPISVKGASNAIQELKSKAMVSASAWTLWTNLTNTTSDFKTEGINSMRSCIGGMEGSILDIFSGPSTGELEWDNRTVRLWNQRGADNGVRIEYGKNLTDLNREDSDESWYTGVVAFWKSTKAVQVGSIQYITNHASYSREKIYILDCSGEFEKTPTVAQLNEKAVAYRDKNSVGVPRVTIKASFVPLWQSEEYKDLAPLEHVSLCDTVTVYYQTFNVDVKTKVIAYDYDVLKERYRSITLGDTRANLSSTLKRQISSTIEKSQVTNGSLYTSDDTIYNTAPTIYSGVETHYLTRHGMNIPYVYGGAGSSITLRALDNMASASEINTVLILTAHNSTASMNTLWIVRRASDLCVQIGGGTGVISVSCSSGLITVTSTSGNPSVYFMPVDGSEL